MVIDKKHAEMIKRVQKINQFTLDDLIEIEAQKELSSCQGRA